MSEDHEYSATPRSGRLTIHHLGASANAFQGALWLAVQELAKTRGTDPLDWLQTLRQKAVRQAKGAITERMPIELEADALQFGVDSLEAAFNAYRDRIQGE